MIGRTPEHGQALVESLLILLVLVPLAIALEQFVQLAMTQQALISGVRHHLMAQFHAESRAQPEPRFELKVSDQPLSSEAVAVLDATFFAVRLAEPAGPGELSLAPLHATQVRGSGRFEGASQFAVWLGERPLSLEESLLVLTDTWQATTADQLAHHVRALSVAGRLQQIAGPLEAVRAVVQIIEPSFARFCPGRLVLESVPEDRLPSRSETVNDWRQAAC